MKTGHLNMVFVLIILAASTLITCVVVSILFHITDEAKLLSNSAALEMSEMSNDIIDSGLMKYNNEDAYGSDVINCVKETLGDYSSIQTAPVYVYVITSTSENKYTNSLYIPYITNFASSYYIKPTAIFEGTIIKNDNGVVIGIKFTQK